MHDTGVEAAAPPSLLAAGSMVALGCAALLARPLALRTVAHPTAMLVVLFAALGVVGWRWPLAGMPDRVVAAVLFQVRS